MMFNMYDFDDDTLRCSLVHVEDSIHREPAVLTYTKLTLRSSFPSFMLSSWS